MGQKTYPRRSTLLLNLPWRFGTETFRSASTLRNFRRLLALASALSALLFIGLISARGGEQTLNKTGRINLIRGLDREIAVAKLSLPRGKHGVFVDAKGSLDRARAQEELRTNGPAISAGAPVEITKIIFKPHDIVFELNGGGKNRRKWYEHLEVGMGNTTQPIVPPHSTIAYGSSITLTYHDEKVPDLSTDQVKQLLSAVLDFSRHLPTEQYSPSVPKEFRDAIQKHQVLVGMDRNAVLSSKGAPDRKVRQVKDDGDETEDWIYGLPPHVLFVTFDGDTVVSVRQY